MEFGIFDHVDRGGTSLHQFYEDRLKMTEAYDRLGFYGYHVAEHHFTPLGLAASPSVFLSCVAQRTKILRFGPMVYILPFYHPLRLAEEICMLDHLSNGRFQVGVGRGISPIEADYFGEASDPAKSRQAYAETLDILRAAFSGKRLSYNGTYRRAENVPFELETFQKPHPPFWMGNGNTLENAETAARSGMNFLSLLSPHEARTRVERYREVTKATSQSSRLSEAKMGLSWFIVVAETDERAEQIAQRAYAVWHRSFHYLYHASGRAPVFGDRPSDFQALTATGRGIAGSPRTVREFLAPKVAEAGINYVVGQFVFGDMSYPEALTSVELFARDVIPALRQEVMQTA